ncbi:hypothetical protein Dimus_011823 [Dionaea muscipula]
MPEGCNSRPFSWLVKSCIPNPQKQQAILLLLHRNNDGGGGRKNKPTISISISILPDDLLLEILSRLPLTSLPSLSLVSRRWSLLLDSPLFLHLRRRHGLLHPTLFALSLPDHLFTLHVSTLRLHLRSSSWDTTTSISLPHDAVSRIRETDLHGFFSQTRLVSTGRRVYILARDFTTEYDSWTGSVKSKSAMLSSRKKFAAAAVSGKIYVTGGSARTSAVEEYDPEKDEWRVVCDAPRRRYGCIGVGIEGLFCVIGGLKIGSSCELSRAAAVGTEAQMYANSMDMYDVEVRCWLRSRAIPGGGCVVAACGAYGHVYVLASHAVELSFWRFSPRKRNDGGGGSRFGEWCRLRSPPLPAQARLDSTVRFGCVGVEDKVVLIQAGQGGRGCREGLVLIFDCVGNEWTRGVSLLGVVLRATCVCVEC